MTPASRSILFCIYSHNMWGGIEFWLREIMSAHRTAGWETMLAVARGKRFNLPRRFLDHFGETSAIQIDGRTGTDEGRILAIERVVRTVSPSIVVPLAIGHALPALGRAKRAGVRSRLVFALHAINARLLADAKGYANVLDLVVGVNPLQVAFLRNAIAEDRLTVVPNGARTMNAASRRPRQPGQPLRFLLASRLDQFSKRVLDVVPMALELCRRGVDFHYVVAGDGPAEAELHAAIVRHGLADRFDLLGFVDPERLQTEVMPGIDILTMFSAGEAFGLVAIEAMSAGCVPIMSEWPGVWSAGYLRPEDTGLVFPIGDVEKAAEWAESLWREPAELTKMSVAATAASREFTWERTRRLWLTAMEDLLRRDPVGLSEELAFPLSRPTRSGRLDRLPFGLGERARRLLRRYPDFNDGWGEWPGTLSGVSAAQEEAALAELTRLDRMARDQIGI